MKGDIDGRFVLSGGPYVAGEPIVVAFELTPRAPLTVFFGGDQRNAANYPMRFSVRARDPSGKVVCDLVDKPPFPSFGGIGSDRTLAKGERYLERFVLNPACPALATPGTWLLELHRRLTDSGLAIPGDGGVPLSCDVVPVHEATPAWLDPKCRAKLDAVPSVTAEAMVTVVPFEPKAARAALEARLREVDKDEILHHRIERWVCGTLSCSCPKAGMSDADLLAAMPASLPAGFPAACP